MECRLHLYQTDQSAADCTTISSTRRQRWKVQPLHGCGQQAQQGE